jgi:ATP-dependent RNA helicase SUPV3L1/SUV3
VIFETIQKSNGVKIVTLTSPEIRQIAGRAGRYRVAPQNTEPAAVTVTVAEAEMVATALPELTNEAIKPSEVAKKDTEPPYPTSPPSLDSRPPFDKNTIGLVTTLEQEDYQTVVTALETPAAPLQTAGILPPDNVIHRFCNYFPPETPFSYILMRLHEICQSSHGFHLCRLKDQVQIADVIHDIQNLDVGERLQLVSAPVAIRDKSQASLIRALATCIAEQRGGALLELPCLNLEVLDKTVTGTRAELKELETLHKGLIMYMWLSFRFPGVFTTRPLANHAKGLVEGAIEKCLRMLNFQDRAKMRKKLREKSVLAEISNDLLKQEWVRNGDEGVIKNKGLEQELNVAADQVEAEDEGVLDSEGGLEAENIQEGTATHDIHNDDEGEYPEEDEGEDEDSTELDPTTLKSESSESTEEFKSWRDDQTQRNTETSTKEGEKSEIFEKADEAKPSVNIPFQSIKRQQGDARVQ